MIEVLTTVLMTLGAMVVFLIIWGGRDPEYERWLRKTDGRKRLEADDE